MASIKVVTDSTADLSRGLLNRYGIEMIPLTINFGNEFYADKIDMSSSRFFAMLEERDELPTTSQPSMGKFKEKYLQLAKEYDSIISIHIASKLSGTYKVAKLAAEMVQEEVDVDIRVIDSKSASLGMGFLAIYAAEAIAEGDEVEEILREIKKRIDLVEVFFTVDTFEYLQKGGRIGKASAFVGDLLNIKPILKVNKTGEVELHSRTRGKKRLFKKIKQLVESNLKERDLDFAPRLGILHGNAVSDLERLKNELNDLVQWDYIISSEISPVIGTHVGPGTLGIVLL